MLMVPGGNTMLINSTKPGDHIAKNKNTTHTEEEKKLNGGITV